MKERKNSAVLGLSTSVATPCASGLRAAPWFAERESPSHSFAFGASFGASFCASLIILTPRKQRYAAPTYLTAENATADRARITEIPKAAANPCTIPPRSVPSADSSPSRFPPAKVRASTYNIPGPGATARRRAAVRNSNSRVESNMMEILRQRLFPQPDFDLCQLFSSGLGPVAIGSRHIKQDRVHTRICGADVVYRVDIAHVQTLVGAHVHGSQRRLKDLSPRFLKSDDSRICDALKTVGYAAAGENILDFSICVGNHCNAIFLADSLQYGARARQELIPIG